MTNEEELLNAAAQEEPQKRKRTRILKKDTDQVYSASGLNGENLDKPKKKRGRPSKAEIAAREAQAAMDAMGKEMAEESASAINSAETAAEVTVKEEPHVAANEEVNADANSEEQAVASATEQPQTDAVSEEKTAEAEEPKKRSRRRTKEEIIAAAALKAQALKEKQAQTRPEAEEIPEAIVEEKAKPLVQELPFPKDDADNFAIGEMPSENSEFEGEQAFATAEVEGADGEPASLSLLEQLQSKMNARREEELESIGPWEGDPCDGTDFIVVKDLPVEDNAAIPYYDIFDTPQMAKSSGEEDVESETMNADEPYKFDDLIPACGLLEVLPDGYGFLRSSDYNYLASPDDVNVPMQMIKQFSLKTGDVVQCRVRPPHKDEQYFVITTIEKVNGRNPLDIRDRISFENLTPLFPDEKFNLCGDAKTTNKSTRIVDLFAPIGKGQRSLIVAQPKTGKTILMKDIANAIAANHPEAYIMILLIDERPEEVTDMARTVNAEVIASTFDEPADRHVKIAGLVLEKAKRMVECGHDVVIFLDSITRLARAYNTVAPASGKVLTGGVDANALQKPKRFFGAARNIENGGSLTIIATALTDTGSKMDEVIFEEFKGTGNSELQLDRQLANKRMFPAVNIVASSTRRDDLLLDETTINRMWIMRNHFADMTAIEAMNEINGMLNRSRTHEQFLLTMNS